HRRLEWKGELLRLAARSRNRLGPRCEPQLPQEPPARPTEAVARAARDVRLELLARERRPLRELDHVAERAAGVARGDDRRRVVERDALHVLEADADRAVLHSRLGTRAVDVRTPHFDAAALRVAHARRR